MTGTTNCIYETPCGWCSKWDKKCDKLLDTNEQPQSIEILKEIIELENQICKSDSDHEWECCGISTAGTDYICKKCYARKTYPHEYNDQITVTI